MRFIISISLILFFLLTFSSCEKTQINAQKEIPKGWKKIENEVFSFSIPPTMKKNEVQGIDSFVKQFENDEIILDIEYGNYSADVVSYLQDYEGKKYPATISGEKTIIVGYDKNKPNVSSKDAMHTDKSSPLINPEKNYVLGVNFPHKNEVISPEDRPAVSFVVSYKNLENQEIAKKILYSIKFKQK